ncbi:MAG: acyltransferase family protein [Firmicutes bacterium]|nr:acyltransferase family protein [Bacillota bacterium]
MQKLLELWKNRYKDSAAEFDIARSQTAKGLAILLLLFYHLFHEAWEIEEMSVNTAPFTNEALIAASRFGNICVAMFVFLTGFGIAKGLQKLSGKSFPSGNARTLEIFAQAIRRAGKLMGNFLLLYLSALLVFFGKLDLAGLYGAGKQGILHGLTDALGLASLFDTPTINETWWYMGLAFALIFLVPVLYLAYEKIGNALLPIALLVALLIPMNDGLRMYLFTAAMGVCAAGGGWPERAASGWKVPALQWIWYIVLLAIAAPLRQNYIVQESYLPLADALIALLLVNFAGGLLHRIPGLRQVLGFLGRHSMNMYLIHTFFYLLVWREVIYYFHPWYVTWLVLILVSLLYSVMLELIKKGGKWLIGRLFPSGESATH